MNFSRPEKISGEMRFLGMYTMTDLLVLVVTVMFGLGSLSDLIYPPLRLWFQLYLIVVILFWMLPSPIKPNQKNMSTLIDILKKDKEIYSPDIFELEGVSDDAI